MKQSIETEAFSNFKSYVYSVLYESCHEKYEKSDSLQSAFFFFEMYKNLVRGKSSGENNH